jgi:hypothetical protein
MATQSSTLYGTNIRHMMTDLTPEKDGKINHNMEDDVIRGATVAFDGEVTFPPPPPKVQAIAAKPKEKVKEPTPEEKRAAEIAAFKAQTKQQVMLLAIGGALMLLAGLYRAGKLHAALHRVRAVGVRRLPGDLECRAFAAHAADGGDQRDFVDHHSGRAHPDRVIVLADHHSCRARHLHGGHQHLRWLPGHPAHARHVPEVIRGRGQWNSDSPPRPTWSRAVLFILSLGGLSGQESAKRAVWYGIAGMAIAVVATLIGPGAGLGWLSIILIALGAVVGYQLATRVQMTQMPELVAIMHSLVGLAAVFRRLQRRHHDQLGAVACSFRRSMGVAGRRELHCLRASRGQHGSG